jgi:hypothetical protein
MSLACEIDSQMRKDGFDIHNPHIIEHYIYVPTHANASYLANELNRCGFKTRIDRSAVDEQWLILASHEIIVASDDNRALLDGLESLVISLGADYDGWEVLAEGGAGNRGGGG